MPSLLSVTTWKKEPAAAPVELRAAEIGQK
jgi:hypothetical protein